MEAIPSDDSVNRAQSGFNISLTNKSNHSLVTPAPWQIKTKEEVNHYFV